MPDPPLPPSRCGCGHVRPELADQLAQPAHRRRSPVLLRCRAAVRAVDRLDPEIASRVLHRPLAVTDAAGDERRLVAARVEASRQVRDVQRRPADVEARDDAENPDRVGRHARHGASVTAASYAATSSLARGRVGPSLLGLSCAPPSPCAHAPRRFRAAAPAPRAATARAPRCDQDSAGPEVGEAPDARRHDRAAVRHRLARGHAVALAPRRDADDRGALVVRRRAPTAATKPTRLRDAVAQRPVADDHARQAVGRLDELEDALLLAEPAREEDVRRLGGRADVLGDRRPAAGRPPPARAPSARASSARKRRRREHDARAAHERANEPRRAPRELDVGAPHLQHVRLSGRARRDRRRDPVRVHEVGVARRPPRRDGERREERRQRARASTAPRAGSARSRRRARRRSAGTRPARRRRPRRRRRARPRPTSATNVPATGCSGDGIRRRQDDDLHSRCAKTTGIASAERDERVEVIELHRQVERVRRERSGERGGAAPRERAHARGERIARRGERAAERARGVRGGGRPRRGTRRRARCRRARSRRSARRSSCAAPSSSCR